MSYVEDAGYEDWGDEWGDGWSNGWQYHVGWQGEEPGGWDADGGGQGDDGDDPRLQELHKVEKDAELMAMEAKRTWSQAQQATAAMRRERGFATPVVPGTKGSSGCFICGATTWPENVQTDNIRVCEKGKVLVESHMEARVRASTQTSWTRTGTGTLPCTRGSKSPKARTGRMSMMLPTRTPLARARASSRARRAGRSMPTWRTTTVWKWRSASVLTVTYTQLKQILPG